FYHHFNAEINHGQNSEDFQHPFSNRGVVSIPVLTGDEQRGITNNTILTQRLPSANSAPHLNCNGQKDDVSFLNGQSEVQGGNEKFGINDSDDSPTSKTKSKISQIRQTIKVSLLVGVWIFVTAVFLMHNEKEEVTMHSSVAPGQIKDYLIQNDRNKHSVLVKLTGPFLSEAYEKKLNISDKQNMSRMDIWLEKWVPKGPSKEPEDNFDYETIEISTSWTVILENQAEDFHESETRSSALFLPFSSTNQSVLAVRMTTTADVTTPFTLSYTLDPLDETTGIIYACILLFALYALIVFEVINRTMAAVLLSTSSLAVLSIAGERPSVPEIISWLDVETLLLLFSMMVLVAILAETGVFDYYAVLTFQLARGKIWPLITMLCGVTSIVSLLLDNVTTVLLVTPVTIRLSEVMELDPIPVLLSMVVFCNLAGTATPVGDPPNIIIASNKQVVQAGINFTNFTLHMTFGILFVAVQTYLQLRFILRDTSKLRLTEPKDVQDLRRQILIWRRAADSLPHLSPDQLVVKDRLERKIKKLTIKLEELIKEAKIRAYPDKNFENTLAEMRKKYKIRDAALLVKCAVTIVFVVIAFFLHSIPEFNRVSLGWTALLGALLLLTLADREDLESVLHRVEWSTLLFFAALFVLMEALSKLGLIGYIGGWTEALILRVDESDRLAVALILMVWVSGITSAFVDNVPLTTMMVRVVTSLGTHPTLNLPIEPLIWALSFGVCLGGNGTLIGASSNVVCVGLAEQHGYKITFMQFFKIGFPVMIGHLVVATAYLLVCHCVFSWH
ncbi:hypothetical protein HW555_013614, partial [Spodoptera exigua]